MPQDQVSHNPPPVCEPPLATYCVTEQPTLDTSQVLNSHTCAVAARSPTLQLECVLHRQHQEP